jgi:tetratricopeptide (TPR) repeat protein
MIGALLAPLLAMPLLGGDILVLKDGRLFDGLSLELVDRAYVVHYPSGDVRVPLESVQDALMEDPPPFVPQSDEERERAAKGQVLHGGKWMTPEKRAQAIEKQLEEKRAELAELRACKEWRNRNIVETKHFRFEFAVPEHVFAPFRSKMESYFEAFAKDWGIKQPRELGKLPVYFYPDYQQFTQVSGAPRGTGGYFRFVTPMELNFFYDHTDPALIEEVMFHETNHYLQKLLALDFSMPHFPGESLAEFYGASRYDQETKEFESGLVLEGRLNEVKQDILQGETWGLEKLVSTDRAYQHYTWGWTLVHYLMHHPQYEKKFQKFVVSLCKGDGIRRELVSFGPDNLRVARGDDVWALFKKELGLRDPEDVTALEAAWHAYVEDELETTSPQGKADAARNAEQGGYVLKAKRLYYEAIYEGDRRAITRHRYAWLLSSEGEHEAAAEQWRAAVELDPMEALYRYWLGRVLRDELGKKEEGLAHLRLARDMNPRGVFDDSWRERIEIDWDEILGE